LAIETGDIQYCIPQFLGHVFK